MWPRYSVVVPNQERGNPGERQFHVGYLNHQEAFRYEQRETALAALLASMHDTGRSLLAGRRVALSARTLVIEHQGVLVYGRHAAAWAQELVAHHGASDLGAEAAMVDLFDGRLWPWPLRTTERPTALDRRGAVLAPLAELVEVRSSQPVEIAAVIRAAPGEAGHSAVLAELAKLCVGDIALGRSEFCGLARLVGRAMLVRTPWPTERAMSHLLAAIESRIGQED